MTKLSPWTKPARGCEVGCRTLLRAPAARHPFHTESYGTGLEPVAYCIGLQFLRQYLPVRVELLLAIMVPMRLFLFQS